MTHDELLAEINKTNPIAVYATRLATGLVKQEEDYILTAFKEVGIKPLVIIEQNALINQQKAQLRAVVELHKPDKEGFCAMNCVEADDSGYAWTQCAYPCPTIQAIEKEVK